MVRRKRMPLIWMTAIWMGTIWTLVSEVGQTREQQFPYVAYVTASAAYVRSGPGQNYYPTQQLPEGFAVEVYRHDGNGWCAVRPPEGSFSWVPAHQVRVLGQAIAEVVTEGVVTRIGSTLSSSRSTVQVLLPKGERVELLAGQAADNPGWLRVVAPAGEFRWVAAKQLSLQPPIEAALPASSFAGNSSSGGSSDSPYNSVLGMNGEQPNVAFRHLQDSDTGRQGSNSFQPPATSPGAANFASFNGGDLTNTDPNAIDVVTGSPAETQLAQFQPQAGGVPSQALPGQPTTAPATSNHLETAAANASLSSPPRIRFRGLLAPAGTTDERVEELQLRLSQIVIQPPEQWRFEQIRSEANRLLEKSGSPLVRSQLRDFLDRIASFQQVRLGHEGNAIAANRSSQVISSKNTPVDALQPLQSKGEGLTGISSKIRELAKNDLSADKPLYDAVGLLKTVTSKRAKAPQYALVDDKGEVVSFVTPTPDLNLKPYIGRRIGVQGKRGFMSEYRRAHVTAERITPLTGRIQRR